MTAPAPTRPQAPFYTATAALLRLPTGAPIQWYRLQAAVPELPARGSFRVRLTLRHPAFHRPRRFMVGVERLTRDGDPIGFGQVVPLDDWRALRARIDALRMAGWEFDPA